MRKLLRAVIPVPIRTLRYRLPWALATDAFKLHPVATMRRLLWFTAAELLSEKFRFQAPDGARYVTMANNFSSFAICLTGQCDPENQRFIRTLLAPGDTFIDVGANIGGYTVDAARAVAHSGRVIAVEAHPNTFRFLSENVALHELGNVQCLNMAIGDTEGSLAMTFEPRNPGETHASTHGEQDGASVSVPMTTLDHLMESETLSRVRYLKIDVEGFELPVLKGARKLLETQRNIVVQTELISSHAQRYGYSTEAIILLMQELGFKPFRVVDGGSQCRPIEGKMPIEVVWQRP